jgi:hypothetical protein
MKRILIVAVSSSALALAAPAIASAQHHGKHHHKHHAARARVVDFRAASPALTSPPASQTAPTGTESAGKVTSLKEGVLTITLTDGTPVSGKVTEQTQIHCTTATPPSTGDDGEDQAGSGEGDHGSSTDAQPGAEPSHDAHAASNGQDGQSGSDDEQQTCTTSALAPGTLVREAELSIGSSGAVWDHIDLIQ